MQDASSVFDIHTMLAASDRFSHIGGPLVQRDLSQK